MVSTLAFANKSAPFDRLYQSYPIPIYSPYFDATSPYSPYTLAGFIMCHPTSWMEKHQPISVASPPSAGSRPGEALAPGIPGGAAKLSDIAKARLGHQGSQGTACLVRFCGNLEALDILET